MGVTRQGSYVAETDERAQSPLMVWVLDATKVSVHFG